MRHYLDYHQEPVDWTVEQKKAAGKDLASLLKRRIAYHHSGLDSQRAGLSNHSRAYQLQVVVATTGLAAGINFSMRSFLLPIVNIEWRMAFISCVQMNYCKCLEGQAVEVWMIEVLLLSPQSKPDRCSPTKLKRSSTLDWSALICIEPAATPRIISNRKMVG